MSAVKALVWALALLLPAVLAPSDVAAFPQSARSAQDLRTATLDRISLSADTIGIGDRFELTVELTIPPGTVAYLPDSLQASAFESLDVFRWESESNAGGQRLRVTYPLIAFQVGSIATPDFEVFVARGDVSAAAGGSDPGDLIGSWSVLVADPSAFAGSRLLEMPSQQLWVASVLLLDQITQGLEPAPPADVTGGNRHWPATLALLVFALALVAATASLGRDWMTSRIQEPLAVVDPKGEALTALDQLLSAKLLERGETRTFFRRSSDIVRRYVEAYDAAWNRARTSTELMGGLNERPEARAEPLAQEMHAAEVVKFGGGRPDAATSEQHVQTVRGWVAESETPE